MNLILKIEKTIFIKNHKVGDKMILESDKMKVAQNCYEYDPKNILSLFSMSTIFESCDNCNNYCNGICKKELFEDILKLLNRN